MTYRWMIAICATLALSACKTTAPDDTSDESTEATARDSEKTDEQTETSEAPYAAPSLDGAPAAVRLSFSSGRLLVTHSDGSFAAWTADDGVTETASLRGTQVPVAWSPGGSLAMLDSDPPVIVRLSDGKEVLRFVNVEQIETADFFPDGSGLFVAEPGGALHVWNESEETLTSVPTDNLESFMERQSPSFSANFSSLSGEATVTSSNELLLGTKSGKLYWWDPDNPKEVNTLVKLPAAIRDTAYAGGKVYATTTGGDFRGADKSSGVFLEWSNGMKADRVAASSGQPTRLLLADNSTLRMVDARDGSAIWTRTLEGTEVCGLALSDDGQTGAVCIDGGVVVFAASDASIQTTMP